MNPNPPLFSGFDCLRSESESKSSLKSLKSGFQSVPRFGLDTSLICTSRGTGSAHFFSEPNELLTALYLCTLIVLLYWVRNLTKITSNVMRCKMTMN